MATKKKATKRRAPAKKAAAAPRRRKSPVKKAAPRRRSTAKRYTGSGKMNFKLLAMDAAATIAGAVAAGVGGQMLAKQGVDARISGIAPVLVGGALALKGKNATLKAIGVGMIVAAGISVVNNVTKSAGLLSGDSAGGLDALDLYSNPDLLGIPMDVSPVMLGIPMDMGLAGSEWQTGCSVN
jgi:hypothetical protein